MRARYDAQLRPRPGGGCRGLVDAGSLLWRWTLTPGSSDVPGIEEVLDGLDEDLLHRPPTPFIALHSAVALCAADDAAGLDLLARSCEQHQDSTQREVAAPGRLGAAAAGAR